MPRLINVAVLGSYNATQEEEQLAETLGQQLAEFDINVVSGGQRGVMKAVCKGVFEARQQTGRHTSITGILSQHDFSDCNDYVDIAIPTGASHLQNAIVPLSGDIVIAVGGSAGTLTEICFAWQFKKPIALLGPGWAGKLAGQQLDSRRELQLPHFTETAPLMDWLRQELDSLPTP